MPIPVYLSLQGIPIQVYASLIVRTAGSADKEREIIDERCTEVDDNDNVQVIGQARR